MIYLRYNILSLTVSTKGGKIQKFPSHLELILFVKYKIKEISYYDI